jgi:hypothetical protein
MRVSGGHASIASALVVLTAALVTSCRSDAETQRSVQPSPIRAAASPTRTKPAATSRTDARHDPAYAFHAETEGSFTARHPTLRMRTVVDARGVTFTWPGEPWQVTVAGARVGCGDALVEMTRGVPRTVESNRVEVTRRAASSEISEWFEHGPRGLEHGFTLNANPCADGGDVVLEVSTAGLEPVARASVRGVDLRDRNGVTRMRYTDLSARDAAGVALGAEMLPLRDGVALRLATAHARFPVVVDPLAWVQVAELTASDGAADDNFGQAVAISGDTVVIGAPRKSTAYVFTQSGGAWVLQQELKGNFESFFGSTVAISGDTAIISDAIGMGDSYVYARSGSTWTQTQIINAQDLALADGGVAYLDGLGAALALSGSTALLGMPDTLIGDDYAHGATGVYAEASGTWTLTQLLTPFDVSGTPDEFGCSVAFAGSTAFICSCYTPDVYVFGQQGSIWTLQQELTVPNLPAYTQSVALSGNTAMLIGGDGQLYEFAQSNGTWAPQQAPRLHNSPAASVALSDNIAVVGVPMIVLDEDAGLEDAGADAGQSAGVEAGVDAGPGAVLVFEQSDAGWSLQQTLAANDGVNAAEFGSAVAISGKTMIVGAPYREVGGNFNQGAAYVEVFGPAAGTPCSSASDCVSEYCVDGVCCDSPCNSLCVACAASLQESTGGAPQDGHCAPARSGTNPHHDSCGPDPSSTCGHDGQCDGTGACQYFASTTTCGSCTGNSLTSSACNGAGACVVGTAASCPNNLVCADDGGICKTSCATDMDCTGGAICSNSACVPKPVAATCNGPSTSRSADGGLESCAPYACGAAGTCNQTCQSVKDCAAGSVCDPGNQCVATPSNSAAGASCASASANAPGGALFGSFVAFAAVVFARRRRREEG